MRQLLLLPSLLLLTACGPNVYKALDNLTRESTGHDSTATLLLNADSPSSSSVEPSSSASSSSSSVYVPPPTEWCETGSIGYRVWSCGPDNHRVYI